MVNRIFISFVFALLTISVILYIDYHAESPNAGLAWEMTSNEQDILLNIYPDVAKHISDLYNYYVLMRSNIIVNKNTYGCFLLSELHNLENNNKKPIYAVIIDSSGNLLAIDNNLNGNYIYKSKLFAAK